MFVSWAECRRTHSLFGHFLGGTNRQSYDNSIHKMLAKVRDRAVDEKPAMSRLHIVVAATWVAVMAVSIAYGVDGDGIGEQAMLAAIAISILTFPLGLVGAWAAVFIGDQFGVGDLWIFISFGALALVAGYIQWFFVVPGLWRRIVRGRP